MATYETYYMTDDTSGDIWAVEVSNGGVSDGDVSIITGVCGPLEHREITMANLEAGNFNFDDDPEQLTWAENTLTKRVEPPYAGDR